MSKLLQAFKQKDMRNKILFTFFILILYRIGVYIPLPGIPFNELATAMSQGDSGMLAVLDMFTGGALGKMSLLSLGIMPYITASIIMQLMGPVIPRVEKWRKEGSEGRKQIIKWTRIITIVLGFINAFAYDIMFQNTYGIQYSGAVPMIISNLLVIFGMMVGVIIIMWMGELITQRGIGNGMSIIILANVVSSIIPAIIQSFQNSGGGIDGLIMIVAAIAFVLIAVPIIVYVERAQRRVTIKSSQQGATAGYARLANTNYIPIPVDIAGVYALIFASCFMAIPVTLALWFPDAGWLNALSQALSSGPVSWVVTFILVILFCFYMSGFNFNCEDIAEDLKKNGSFIPGVRPGEATEKYLHFIVNHLTLFGSIFIACWAVISAVMFYYTNNLVLQCIGGTSILIMISVPLQTMMKIDQNLRASDPEAVLKRLG